MLCNIIDNQIKQSVDSFVQSLMCEDKKCPLKDSQERRHEATKTSPSKGNAKVLKDIELAKTNLENLAIKYTGIQDPRGFLTDLTNVLGIDDSDRASRYTVANLNLGDKTIKVSIRVSAHNANATNFPRNLDYALSIVVSRRFKKKTFKACDEVKMDEYVYMGNALYTVDSPLSQICRSLIGFLNTGVYNDTTQIAKVNHSPVTVDNNRADAQQPTNLPEEVNISYNKNNSSYMKNTIRLTESQLKEVIAESVKSILTELDWKTYQNAFRKAQQRAESNPNDIRNKYRARSFQRAAADAFNNEYGMGDANSDEQYFMWKGTGGGNKSGMPMTHGRVGDKSIDYGQYGDYISNPDYDKCYPEMYQGFGTFGNNKDLGQASAKGNRQIDDYVGGDYQYDKGKGWYNNRTRQYDKYR